MDVAENLLSKAFLADKRHNNDLCELASSVEMPGNIEVIYERGPDFFCGLEIQGKFNQIGVCYDQERITGMGCRSVKPMFVHGSVMDFGYLHGLRARSKAAGKVTARIFQLLAEVHKDHQAPGYLTTVTAGNAGAGTALLGGRYDFMPQFLDLGGYTSHVIFLNRRARAGRIPGGLRMVRGSELPLAEILAFLHKNGKNRQFFPYYTAQDFASPFTSGLDPRQMYIAVDNGGIKGVCGLWDQHYYKRHVIRRYSPLFKTLKPLASGLLRLGGYQGLPEEGETLHSLTLGLICIEDENVQILQHLIDRIREDYKNSPYGFILAGFHDKDPLKAAVAKLRHVPYRSQLFFAHWQDGSAFAKELANECKRVPYLELATL